MVSLMSIEELNRLIDTVELLSDVMLIRIDGSMCMVIESDTHLNY